MPTTRKTDGQGAPTAIVDVRGVRRALSQARGKRKLDLILSAPDPESLIRALPAEELYFALLEIGPDDSAELVALATPEQFRHFVDMAAWPRSDAGPRASEVVRWLRLAREGGGASDRDLARYRKQLWTLDVELLSLVLLREVKVHDLTEEAQPQPADPGLAYYTPDRRFLLEFSGASGYAAMKQLVDDLYAQDPFGASRLIEAVRWEVPTELEESARRWRDGRLRDLGVPEFDEAISFYARPARADGAEAPRDADAKGLVPAGQDLLDAALGQLSPEELERAEEAVVYAANAALVANRVPVDDPDEVREQLADARATLSLGVELLSGGDPARAARLLVETPVRQIFQSAMGEAYRLQARARSIAARARLPQAQAVTLLDPPLAQVIDALSRQRPAFHEPGQRRPRALGNRADAARAEALLDEAEATVALLQALGIPPAELGPKAEEAGVAPTALRASDAVLALASSKAGHRPFALRGAADETPQPRDLLEARDQLLRAAVEQVGGDAARRAADRLRAAPIT